MAKKKLTIKNVTLIVGCGRLGSSIANKYCASGKNVIVVDNHNDSFDRLSDSFSGYKFVGDATDINILETAYINKAKEIIIATGDDNTNLLVAHIARKLYGVPEVYVRLSDPESNQLLKGLNIKAIFPFELSFEEFEYLKGAKK